MKAIEAGTLLRTVNFWENERLFNFLNRLFIITQQKPEIIDEVFIAK